MAGRAESSYVTRALPGNVPANVTPFPIGGTGNAEAPKGNVTGPGAITWDERHQGPPVQRLSDHQRSVIIEALASALVEDYLADTEEVAGSPGDSPAGAVRSSPKKHSRSTSCAR